MTEQKTHSLKIFSLLVNVQKYVSLFHDVLEDDVIILHQFLKKETIFPHFEFLTNETSHLSISRQVGG